MLFALLEDAAAPVITAAFLEDLSAAYKEVTTEDEQLAQILLLQALKRLSLAKQSTPFSSAVLTHRVTALSNLLSAQSVCKILSSLIQE